MLHTRPFFAVGDQSGYTICSGFGCTTNMVTLTSLTFENDMAMLEVVLERDSSDAIDEPDGVVLVNGVEVHREGVSYFPDPGNQESFVVDAVPGDTVTFIVESSWEPGTTAAVSAVVPGDGGNGASPGSNLPIFAIIGGAGLVAIYLFGDE